MSKPTKQAITESAGQGEVAAAAPTPMIQNKDEVICPNCTHQFRAIPVNVQAELAACREDAERYRWLREQFELLTEESFRDEFVRHAKDGDVYKTIRDRWCLYQLKDDWRFGENIIGDDDPKSFDSVIDAARKEKP